MLFSFLDIYQPLKRLLKMDFHVLQSCKRFVHEPLVNMNVLCFISLGELVSIQ